MTNTAEGPPIVLMNYVKSHKHDFKNKHAGGMAVKRAAEYLERRGIVKIVKSLGLNTVILNSKSRAAAYFFEEKINNTKLTVQKISIQKNNIKTKLTNRENKILNFIYDKKYVEISQCQFLGRGYYVAQKINDIIDIMLKLWKKGLIRIIRVKDGFLACPLKDRIQFIFSRLNNKPEWFTNDAYRNVLIEQELLYYQFIDAKS